MKTIAAGKVLVVYATWTGATREVAEAVARRLQGAGLAVDVAEAATVKDLAPYDAVVIGNSVHAGKLTRHTVKFARSFATQLAQKPVAWFLVCLAMVEDKPDTREMAMGYLKPLVSALPGVTPVAVGLFAGGVLKDTPEAKGLWFPLSAMAGAMVKVGDHRDWAVIEAWADALAPKLAGQAALN